MGRPKARVKAFAPKVKTGCITCKIRRVKCGEEKPACKRCTSTGRVCDGYVNLVDGDSPTPSPPKSSSVLVVARRKPTSVHNKSATTSWNHIFEAPQIPLFTVTNPQEQRSLDYFRQRTVPQLAGFFPSEFWQVVLMQAVNHVSAIRHAVIAVGSIHERFEAKDPSIFRSNYDRENGGFALEQYVSAISGLTDRSQRNGQLSLDVALTACILFTCFETLRGHHGSALGHVDSGIKILLQISNEVQQQFGASRKTTLLVPTCPVVPLSTLHILMTRLDTQATQLGIWRARSLDTAGVLGGIEPGFSSKIPAEFTTLLEARNSMDFIWNAIMHFGFELDFTEIPEAMITRQRHLDNLELWQAAFQTLLQHQGSSSNVDRHAANILQVQYRSLVLMVTVLEETNDMVWDDCEADFADILDLATDVVYASRASFSLNGIAVPTFSMDSGIVVPLFQVAYRCRDPIIRRRAISLLESSPRQEGVWDGILVARVCKRIVEIEEEGLGVVLSSRDIPQPSRVSSVDAKFDLEERKAVLSYVRRGSGERGGGDTVRETHMW